MTGPDGSYALHMPSGTYRVGIHRSERSVWERVFQWRRRPRPKPTTSSWDADDVANIDANMALNHPITGIVSVDGVDMPGVAVTAWRQVPGGAWVHRLGEVHHV